MKELENLKELYLDEIKAINKRENSLLLMLKLQRKR